MSNLVQLTTTAVEPERPFSDVDNSREDLAAMRYMAERLRAVLSETATAPEQAFPLTIELTHDDRRQLRIVINQWSALTDGEDIQVVGFFGQRREEVDPMIDADKDTIDDELIQEFPSYPGVLSYSSLEMPSGEYGNLVLLRGAEAAGHWMTSARHSYATRVIAPKFYCTIRLHNAAIAGGLGSNNDIVMQRTKYYDFRGDWPWLAVREYDGA